MIYLAIGGFILGWFITDLYIRLSRESITRYVLVPKIEKPTLRSLKSGVVTPIGQSSHHITDLVFVLKSDAKGYLRASNTNNYYNIKPVRVTWN